MSLLLSVIVPCKQTDDPQLIEFLSSIRRQTLEKEKYEVLVITEGNSEEAKAIGIQRAQGKILGLFCADNVLRDSNFLTSAIWDMEYHKPVIGLYSAQYDYVRSDKALSRYFALLGANDPLCWWLGKADRMSYFKTPVNRFKFFSSDRIPSIGCNGFFVWADKMKAVVRDTSAHFPMDAVVDLVRKYPFSTSHFFVPASIKVWHKSGENAVSYFRRRYAYVRDLYFRQICKRRWHMVGKDDFWKVAAFCAVSVLSLPHLWASFQGYRKVKDPAWFLHVPVCFVLTFIYGFCFLRWGLRRPSLSPAWADRTRSNSVWNLSKHRPVSQKRL